MADLLDGLWVLEHPLLLESNIITYINKLVIHINIFFEHLVSLEIFKLKIIEHPRFKNSTGGRPSKWSFKGLVISDHITPLYVLCSRRKNNVVGELIKFKKLTNISQK